MNRFHRFLLLGFSGGLCLGAGALAAQANTLQTVGSGSAVTTVDLSANFDAFTDDNLAVYSEGGLSVTTQGYDYSSFDPFGGAGNGSSFYYPAGATNGWITIETDDLSLISGVEFLYGNGWFIGENNQGQPLYGSDSAVLAWQTLDGSTILSSGTAVLNVGTVVGFSDPTGFQTLQVSALRGPGVAPGTNALALDNLRVELTPPSSVPDGAMGTGATLAVILSVFAFRRQGPSSGL